MERTFLPYSPQQNVNKKMDFRDDEIYETNNSKWSDVEKFVN